MPEISLSDRYPYSYTTLCYDYPPVSTRALDIFKPHEITKNLGVLFVHGGSWRAGTRTQFHSIMHALNQQGWVCGSLDYRLNQVSAWDQVADVRLGRSLFTEHLKSEGCSGDLVMVGSSAGAHLMLLEAMSTQEPNAAGLVAVSAPLTFEPWPDMFPPIYADMCAIAGASYADHPELYRNLSPIHCISSKTPPICLLDGTNEHMFPSFLAD